MAEPPQAQEGYGIYERYRAEACLTLKKLYDAIGGHDVAAIAECFHPEFELFKDGNEWREGGSTPRTTLWLQTLYGDLYTRYPQYRILSWKVHNIRMNVSQRWIHLRVHSTIQDATEGMLFEEYAIYLFDLAMQKDIEEGYTETQQGLVRNEGLSEDLPDTLRLSEVLEYIHVLPLIRRVDFVQRDEEVDYEGDDDV